MGLEMDVNLGTDIKAVFEICFLTKNFIEYQYFTVVNRKFRPVNSLISFPSKVGPMAPADYRGLSHLRRDYSLGIPLYKFKSQKDLLSKNSDRLSY